MIYSRASIESLRSVIDPKDILVDIGEVPYDCISDTGSEIRCNCPLHQGDEKTAFSWKRSDGIWSCFSKHCGELDDITRDVFGFVMLKKGLTFMEAVNLLSQKYNVTLEEGSINKYSEFYRADMLNKMYSKINKCKIKKLKELKDLPGYCSDSYAFDCIKRYLYGRGYKDLSILDRFNLYPCLDRDNLRIGIPAYDDDNRLVGVNARRLDGILEYDQEEPKYKFVSGYNKGSILYNLNNAKQYTQQSGLILVEGEFSTIRMYSYGFINSVCSMGSTLTTQQLSLIYKYTYHLIFLIEEGEAALNGVYRSIKNIIPNSLKISIAKLDEGDPDNNRKEVIKQKLENKRILTNLEVMRIKEGENLL